MAAEYKIIYTYTGQGNTSANRSVALNRFKVTGDTNRTIGQIKSITYAHWHTSTNPADWALRGRLVLADGTVFTSSPVTHRISGNKVQYINAFETLPTPEQLASLSKIQTLDSQDKTTAGGYSATLYWRASKDNPMVLTVTFVEEPPVVYNPKIEEFEVVRCDNDGVPNDEGESASVSLKISMRNAASLKNAILRIYYAANAYPEVGVSDYIDLSARISEFTTGVTDRLNVITGKWSAGYSWYYAAVLITGEESAVDTVIMPRAMGSLHVAANHGGICVCGFSNGTADNPMFESYAPGHFYSGIYGGFSYANGEIDTGGKWIDGRKIYRRIVEVNASRLNELEELIDMPDALFVVNMYGSVTRTSGTQRFPLTFWFSDTNYHSFLINNGKLSVKTSAEISGHVIIEYTKNEEATE